VFQSGPVEERSRRIVETVVELAERGGFEAVRLRDVADQAGVALGTLYRRFRSKEDLLVAALEREAEQLEARILAHPPRGADAVERVAAFFAAGTRGLCRRPNLTRAVLRALTSGDPDIAEKVSGFHERMARLITVALRGAAGDPPPSERERTLALLLEHIWFSCLVGWSGGLHSQAAVVEQLRTAAALLLERGNSRAAAGAARSVL
jgi:AcrR family transcriptional regulator